MNMRVFNLFGIIGFFPLWVFRSNFDYKECIIVLFILYLTPVFFHFLIRNIICKYNKLLCFYLASIFFYSVDNSIGLWNVIDKVNFFIFSYYFHGLLFAFLIIFFVSLIFFFEKKNTLKVFLTFMFVVFLFDILNFNKNPNNFPSIYKSEFVSKKNHDKTLVIFFDELSGIESFDSNHEFGKANKIFLLNTLKKNNFEIYINAYSDYGKTLDAIPTVLNGNTDKKSYLEKQIKFPYLKKSGISYSHWTLKENKFFDSYKDLNITVFQSKYINFCDHHAVKRCYQYNPFKKYDEYLVGFNYNFISRIISFYKNNSSITGNILWRGITYLEFADSLLEPEGQKVILPSIMRDLEEEIIQNKTNLIFLHLLSPHVPYFFNEKCEYDRGRSKNYNFISETKKIYQYNLETKCTFIFINKFFKNIQNLKKFDELKIILVSDHDSRIKKRDKNSVLFAIKNKKSNKSNIIEEAISTQKIFKTKLLK